MKMSPRGSRLLAATAAILLTIAPITADARLGGGGSMGSRGGMTFSAPPSTRIAPNGASQFDRSLTQRAPMPGPVQGMPMARPSFMSGLMGGIIGAGLFGLLFGGGFFGHGLGFGGMIGFLFQIFLLFMVVKWLLRHFAGSMNPALASGGNIFSRGPTPLGTPRMGTPRMSTPTGGGIPNSGPPPIQITPADFQAFEQLLQATQAAWSAGDLNALRGMATPEMVSYFSEQMTELSSRGVTNNVTSVTLQGGDLSQAWSEGGRDYATVAMRFSMIDVTKDNMGRIVDGSATEHVTAPEFWTFVRSKGGRWILSAIQQAR